MDFTPCPGGCCCGAIRYEIVADPVTLYACHCTDCQTSTGSSFALSLLLTREALVPTRGEPEPYEFRLSDGLERRGKACGTCRTFLWGVPRRAPELRNLQPGTLDDTGWLRPVGHIWTRSAQPWLALPDDGALRFERQPDDEGMLALVRAWKHREG